MDSLKCPIDSGNSLVRKVDGYPWYIQTEENYWGKQITPKLNGLIQQKVLIRYFLWVKNTEATWLNKSTIKVSDPDLRCLQYSQSSAAWLLTQFNNMFCGDLSWASQNNWQRWLPTVWVIQGERQLTQNVRDSFVWPNPRSDFPKPMSYSTS